MGNQLTPIEVFYCYAREDEVLRNTLEKHLSILHRQGLISSWHDRKIVPGTNWAREIDAHLETASLILLLTHGLRNEITKKKNLVDWHISNCSVYAQE
jgi:hypothetical protein